MMIVSSLSVKYNTVKKTASNLSVTKTVGKTYIHRNTCMRQIKRIEKISQLDLDDPKTRLELELVLR